MRHIIKRNVYDVAGRLRRRGHGGVRALRGGANVVMLKPPMWDAPTRRRNHNLAWPRILPRRGRQLATRRGPREVDGGIAAGQIRGRTPHAPARSGIGSGALAGVVEPLGRISLRFGRTIFAGTGLDGLEGTYWHSIEDGGAVVRSKSISLSGFPRSPGTVFT